MAIIAAPSALRSAQVSIKPVDTLAEVRGSYAGVETRLDFGGEWWTMQIVTPVMEWADAAAVSAWCDLLREADAVAKVAVPVQASRLGTSAANTLTITAPAAAGQRLVSVSGIGANATLLAGSFVQTASFRLHRLREDVTADGLGNGVLSLFPRLRTVLAAEQALSIGATPPPFGLWRLSGRPGHEWDANRGSLLVGAKTLNFIEALS